MRNYLKSLWAKLMRGEPGKLPTGKILVGWFAGTYTVCISGSIWNALNNTSQTHNNSYKIPKKYIKLNNITPEQQKIRSYISNEIKKLYENNADYYTESLFSKESEYEDPFLYISFKSIIKAFMYGNKYYFKDAKVSIYNI